MRFDLHGHFWTVAPWLFHTIRPAPQPPTSLFSVRVADPKAGAARLSGRMRHLREVKSLLVVVHGLGGSAESHYMRNAAAAAERAGLACLRLNLRGAGGGGADFYHAGLYEDLRAAIASPELARYERVFVLGYSIGGHIALRYAASGEVEPRVRAVAAVCPPIDLERSATAIDAPGRWLYRRHVLAGLKEMYVDVASRRAVPVPVREALSIGKIRAWDARIVAPRFGFQSAEHYYREESAAPRLGDLGVPTLLIAAEADPMVPADTLRPGLESALAGASLTAPPKLDVRWLPLGGHVGFPTAVSLGFEALSGGGLEPQLVAWLEQH